MFVSWCWVVFAGDFHPLRCMVVNNFLDLHERIAIPSSDTVLEGHVAWLDFWNEVISHLVQIGINVSEVILHKRSVLRLFFNMGLCWLQTILVHSETEICQHDYHEHEEDA